MYLQLSAGVSLTTCFLTRSSLSVQAISQHPHGVSLYQAPCLYLAGGGGAVGHTANEEQHRGLED